MDKKHGTSDEYVDPCCDLCFEGKRQCVSVYGYCKNCNQFLCSDCHIVHGRLQVARDHITLHGPDMPQSQADKPPKFNHCDVHPTLEEDKFCLGHKTLICSSCSISHTNCIIQNVETVCKNVNASEADTLYDAVKDLQDQARSIMLSVETNVKKVEEQKKSMVKEAQKLYDTIISKANELLQDIHSDIEKNCQSQILLMSQLQDKIKNMIAKLESSLTDIGKFKGKPINTKSFLKIQEKLKDTNQITCELRSLYQSLSFVDISFIPSQTIQDFPSASCTFRFAPKSHTKQDTSIRINDLSFPCAPKSPAGSPLQPSRHRETRTGSLTRQHSYVEVTSQCNRVVRIKEDKNVCYITGMAITEDGRKLFVDFNNDKVKMFSQYMIFLSSVSVHDKAWDIAVISENEAVITTVNKSLLVVLDISDNQLKIKDKIKYTYNVRSIINYENKLFISSSKPHPSAKLIDLDEKVYWSAYSDQEGHPLFDCPWYLARHDKGHPPTVIVSDFCKSMLTFLGGENGKVITRRYVQKKGPKGVTTDAAGNIYVCYGGASEVALLSKDLSEEKILLSKDDGLNPNPQAIVYDDKSHQLLISYIDYDIVHTFTVSVRS